jgi:hypothetical protein
VKRNLAFCYVCRHFGVLTSQLNESLLISGFNKWNKARERFNAHQKSHIHATSALKAINYKNAAKNSVVNQLYDGISVEINRNKEYIKELFRNMLFCLSRGLALRGNKIDKGNFISLIEHSKAEL